MTTDEIIPTRCRECRSPSIGHALTNGPEDGPAPWLACVLHAIAHAATVRGWADRWIAFRDCPRCHGSVTGDENGACRPCWDRSEALVTLAGRTMAEAPYHAAIIVGIGVARFDPPIGLDSPAGAGEGVEAFRG